MLDSSDNVTVPTGNALSQQLPVVGQQPHSERLWFLKAAPMGTRALPSPAKTMQLINGAMHALPETGGAWKFWTPRGTAVSSRESYVSAVKDAVARGQEYLVHGDMTAAGRKAMAAGNFRRTGRFKEAGNFADYARRGYCFDFDPTTAQQAWLRKNGANVFTDPVAAIKLVRDNFMPPELRKASLFCGLSSSAGKEGQPWVVKVHFWAWLKEPRTQRQASNWAAVFIRQMADGGWTEKGDNGQLQGGLDVATLRVSQPVYICPPRILGGPDPIPQRYFELPGNGDMDMPLVEELKQVRLKTPKALGDAVKDESGKVLTEAILGAGGYIWPHSWRDCMMFLGTASTHETIRQATYRLAQGLVRDGLVTPSTPEARINELAADSLAEMANILHGAGVRGIRPPDRMSQAIKELPRFLMGALGRQELRAALADDANTVEPIFPACETVFSRDMAKERAERVCAPKFPDAGLPVAVAKNATHEALRDFMTDANAFHAATPCADGLIDLDNEFPKTIILRSSMSLGKTTGLIRELLAQVDLRKFRFLLFVPDHALAEQIAAEFETERVKLSEQKRPCSAFVFKGREQPGMCEASTDERKAANTHLHNVSRLVCGQCSCPYRLQNDETGAGLKLFTHKHISGGIQSIKADHLDPRKQPADAAPIFGTAIDESFFQSLTNSVETGDKHWARSIEWLTVQSADELLPVLPSAGPKDTEQTNKDKRLLAKLESKAAAFGAKYPNAVVRIRAELSGLERQTAAINELLAESNANSSRIKALKLRGAAEVRRVQGEANRKASRTYLTMTFAAMKDNTTPPQPTAATLRVLSKAFEGAKKHADTVAIANGMESPEATVARDTRDRLEWLMWCARLVAAGNPASLSAPAGLTRDGDNLQLWFLQEMPAWMNNFPLLILDGTADAVLSRAVLSHRRYGMGYTRPFFGLEVVKVQAEDRGVFRVKVLDAPSSMAHVLTDGLRDVASKVAEAWKKTGAKGAVKAARRLPRDSKAEQFYRIVRAFSDRVEPSQDDAPSVALFGYKAWETYLLGNGMLQQHVGAGHFGALRGRNDFSKVKLAMGVGRTLPAPEAVANLSRCVAAFAPELSEPVLGPVVNQLTLPSGYIPKREGIRLRDGSGFAVNTLGVEDTFCQRIMDQMVQAEADQVAHRTRGIWREVGDEVLYLHFDNIVGDLTYDAVIDWKAFGRMNEFGALLHGQGWVPEKPSEQVNAGDGLFVDAKQAENLAFEGVEDERVVFTFSVTERESNSKI